MFNLSSIVIWICKRFNREQINLIIKELNKILKDPNSEIQPKDTFKEDHPNYRKFDVDPGLERERRRQHKKDKKLKNDVNQRCNIDLLQPMLQFCTAFKSHLKSFMFAFR